MRTTLLTILFIALFIGCRQEEEDTLLMGTFKCNNPALTPYFPGYSYSEVSPLIMRTYFKDSLFDSLISEQIYPVDSYNGFHNCLTLHWLSPNNDYEFILPVAADTYRISRITVIPKTVTRQYSPKNPRPVDCANESHFSDIVFTCNGAPASLTFTSMPPGNNYYLAFRK